MNYINLYKINNMKNSYKKLFFMHIQKKYINIVFQMKHDMI